MSQIFLRALLAALPLLSLTLEAKSGFSYGAIGASVFLLAALLLFTLQLLLPSPLSPLSFLLLLLVLGVLGKELFSLSPLFLAGLLLLPVPEFFQPRKNWGKRLGKAFLLSLSFWAFLAGHGILSELLGEIGGVRLFQLPAGSYLLAGLAATLLPRSRRGK